MELTKIQQSDYSLRIRGLWLKYVGQGSVNLAFLRNVIQRELTCAEAGAVTVTRDLLRELRADRNYVSMIYNRAKSAA